MADSTFGCRRLWALLSHLPPESCLIRDGELWPDTNYLLALLGDLIAAGFQIKGEGGGTYSVPRPNEKEQRHTAADAMKDLMKGG